MPEEIKEKKPGTKEAEQSRDALPADQSLETAKGEKEVDWSAFEDKDKPEKGTPPESEKEPEVSKTPETIFAEQPPEKEKPIEPPKEGLAPEVELLPVSQPGDKPENLSSIVPGGTESGRKLAELEQEVKKSTPISEIKKSIKKGDPASASELAENMHNENSGDELDKAA